MARNPVTPMNKVTHLFCATCAQRFYLGPGDRHRAPEHDGHFALGIVSAADTPEEELDSLFSFWLLMN